jgi:hypothetical protein
MTRAITAFVGLVFLAAALVLGWWTMETVNRRPSIGALSLFVWLAALVLFIEDGDLYVKNLGGINVSLPDVLCAFLGGIAALRFLRGLPRIAPALVVSLAVFTSMLALSYIRGLATFGLQHATNEFREFFYFLSALVFALSYPSDKLAVKLPWVGVVGGGLLVLVAVLRFPMMGGFQLDERAVPSYAALAIGQAFFLGWFWLRQGPRAPIWQWLIFGFLPFSFLMLHRSVWMALGGGLAGLFIYDHQGRKRLFKTLLVGGIVGAAVLGFAFGDRILTGVDQAVNEATSSEDSTFIWRLEGWEALLFPETGWSVADILIGRPMGSGYARTLGNSLVNAAEIESGVIPHNYYVSMLLRGGIVGLVAFVAFHVKLMKILMRQAREENPSPLAPCFVIILVTQLIYYVPYSADLIQGVLLGGATAFATAATAATAQPETRPIEYAPRTQAS